MALSLIPRLFKKRKDTIAVPIENDYGDVSVIVIEWTKEFPRSMLLCDEHGAVLGEIAPGIQAPGLEFTIYVRWAGFRALENELLLADLGNPVLSPVIEAAREAVRTHLRTRLRDKTAELIEDWKRADVYPYRGESSSAVEVVEREVFDVVAVAAATAVNAATDRPARRLSLRLLRQAIETRPASLHQVLQEVLDLPQARVDELASLLRRTSLADIISAAKIVTDRLDFLRGLDVLLFEPNNKRALLERTQLHRILASETWVFGDQFSLTVDDETLTEVLRKHLALLGRSDLASEVEERVLTENGVHGVVDLMLSRALELPQQRHHLVVELKRPVVKIGPDEITQIEKYAFAVVQDARFADTNTRWDFWIISNEMTDYALNRSHQQNAPAGVIHQADRFTIWARTWAQVLEECRHRLTFIQTSLNYRSTRDNAVEYLREVHGRLLPESLREPRDSPT